MAIYKYARQTSAVTLLTTELNAMASGDIVVSSVGGTSGVFENLAGGGTTNLDGYTRGVLELVLDATGNTVTNAGAVNVWFLRTVDGTNYENGDTSFYPYRPADVTIYPRGVATAQRIMTECNLPSGKFKVLVQAVNLGGGSQIGTSSNTLKVTAQTVQTI